jgi:putative hydrolase of the HAD superfamily
MIRVVLFDFGGVLSESGRTGFMRQMFAEVYGIDPARVDVGSFHYRARRGKTDESYIFEELNKRFGKQVTKQDFVAHVQAAYVPAAPVLALVQQLREHGIRTGILSNVFSMNADELRKKGLYDGFDPVILSCDVGHAKPDEAFYEIALERCAVQPDEILFIDDQEKCLPPAQKLGIHTILAESSQQIVADTKRLIKQLNGVEL